MSNILKEEKEKSEKLNQRLTIENKKILEEQNQVLEQQVQKRTHELQESNEELQVMNEELRQTYEELETQRDFVAEQNEMLNTKNNELNFSNQKIRNSIKSAKTIQQALLPTEEKLSRTLAGYFLIYRPKDVVAGDFYWTTVEGKKTYLAVADCTGHGVPGAFMANMGITFLYSLIRQKRLEDPAEILNMLHREISVSLKQSKTGNNNGMDIALLSMEKLENQQTKITFCGAKRPLYYISSEDTLLQETKGIRKAIGGIQNRAIKFTTEEIILPKSSFIYLGSDGLADQNNIQRKKLGGKKLKQIIQENYHLPFVEQKSKLEAVLEKHMEGTLQRDDILWMGIKV